MSSAGCVCVYPHFTLTLLVSSLAAAAPAVAKILFLSRPAHPTCSLEELDALWIVGEGVSDLLLLSASKAVAVHVEFLERSLSCEDSDERQQALFPTACKPWLLISDGELLDRIDGAVGNRLPEIITVLSRAVSMTEAEFLQTAVCDGAQLAHEVEEHLPVLRSSTSQVVNFDALDKGRFDDKLAEGPLFKLVLVNVVFNLET